MKCLIRFPLFMLFCASISLEAQIISFPYSESFDGVKAPALPAGWSSVGFKDTASTPHSPPNCIYGIGNTAPRYLLSPIFDFTNRNPDRLTFWERRSGSATVYRLEVRASLDGINFNILLARYETISSTSGYIQRVIDLEGSGLLRQSSVRFQWQLLEDHTNSTGVLRIDDVSLTVTTGYDIGIASMSISPINATRKDTLTFSICAKNYGSLAVSPFSIQFYSDENLNGKAESNELFSVVDGLTLNSGDSLKCETRHLPIRIGEYRYIAVVGFFQDENTANDTMHLVVNIRCMKGDILINEIMYSPAGDEPEWVEFYNVAPDSINLKNWRISDNNVSAKSFLTQSDRIIAPNSYIIAAKDTSFALIHPAVSFIISNFSALNNTTSDAVILYDNLHRSVDSVVYQPVWGGQDGKSLERIDVHASSILKENWQESQDSLGCTPGKINSVARLDYDLEIRNLTQTKNVSDGKLVPIINFTVQNIGRQPIDSVIVYFYSDRNVPLLLDTSELLLKIISNRRIFPGDSIQISEPIPQLAAGEMNVVVIAENWRDERLRNNGASIMVKIGYEPCSLIINEIMYDPLDNQNEWVEFYNRSTQPIDLAHWSFHDKTTLSGINSFIISDSSLIVRSNEFVVVGADSSLFSHFTNIDSTNHTVILNHSSGFSFNNDGDAIVLNDLTNKTIDSVAYLPNWHHTDVVDTRGRSLERINPNIDTNDPRNWSTCTNAAGGTPGKVNSVMTISPVSNSAISISPNPFSPDGDGFEDYCIIRYNLSMMTSTINIRIYDIRGRLIRVLSNGDIAGTQGEIIWNGFDDNKRRARIGVYVIFLEATDRSSGRVERAKAVAVVATKL